MGCFVAVPQDRIYIIESSGKYQKDLHAGFHFLGMPGVNTVAGILSTRITPLDVLIETKTKDNVFVHLTVTIQYRVAEGRAEQANYTLQYPIKQIKSYVYDVVRAAVPRLLVDELFLSKRDIAQSVFTQLKDQMIEFGFDIVDALITNIVVDSEVRAAMNEINAEKRLKQAAVYQSEAVKVQLVAAAEAAAERQRLQGTGLARKRKVIVNGMKEAIKDFSSETGIDEKNISDLVLVTQYLDALKEMGAHKNCKVVMYQDEGVVSDNVGAMREAMLQAAD